jgi:hypothetical protein
VKKDTAGQSFSGKYEYHYQKYEYEIELPPENARKYNVIEVPGLFLIQPFINDEYGHDVITDNSGKLFVFYDKRHSLRIGFSDINNEINYIHFNNFELINKNGTTNNLLNSNDIVFRIGIYPFGPLNASRTRLSEKLFRKNNIVYINNSSEYGEKVIRNDLGNYYKEEEKFKYKINYFMLGFLELPINYLEDDYITIKINLDIVMIDNTVENKIFEIKFNQIYRKWTSEDYTDPDTMKKIGKDHRKVKQNW